MDTKVAQRERRMTTMQRVLGELRLELEQKKAQAPRTDKTGQPPRRKPSKPRRPGRGFIT